jgi:hypothetical protein
MPNPVRRRIEFDAAIWHVLNNLSLDTGKRLQDLADEAFRDLLKKYRRPVTLRDALPKACVCIPPMTAHHKGADSVAELANPSRGWTLPRMPEDGGLDHAARRLSTHCG